MRYIITISFIQLVGCLHAQVCRPDSLLQYELAYYQAHDDTVAQTYLVRKVNHYLRNRISDAVVFKEICRVKTGLLANNQSTQSFLWNAAMISYLNHENDRAAFYLNSYYEMSADSSFSHDLLSYLIYKYRDSVRTKASLEHLVKHDAVFSSLSCFMEVGAYEKKHLNRYLISSAILPGSGSMMTGYVVRGFISLTLVAGSVYGVMKLVEYGLYANAVLWGGGVGLKFYTGNIKLTEQLFFKSEARKKNKLATECELKLTEILDRYPLSLKGL